MAIPRWPKKWPPWTSRALSLKDRDTNLRVWRYWNLNPWSLDGWSCSVVERITSSHSDAISSSIQRLVRTRYDTVWKFAWIKDYCYEQASIENIAKPWEKRHGHLGFLPSFRFTSSESSHKHRFTSSLSPLYRESFSPPHEIFGRQNASLFRLEVLIASSHREMRQLASPVRR